MQRGGELRRAGGTGLACLAIALLLSCSAERYGARGAAVEAKESARLLSRLEGFCRDKCQQRLGPEGDGCAHFCGFVNHIRIAHEADVYALYRDQRNIQPLMWAMNDVVQEKLQAKLDYEDDHAVGELFFEKAKGWYAYCTSATSFEASQRKYN